MAIKKRFKALDRRIEKQWESRSIGDPSAIARWKLTDTGVSAVHYVDPLETILIDNVGEDCRDGSDCECENPAECEAYKAWQQYRSLKEKEQTLCSLAGTGLPF